MKKVWLIYCLLFLVQGVFALEPIDILESKFKVGAASKKVFYYGFAAGDELIFSFEEVKGKELSEVEISEMPSSSKFMDYKTTKVSGKVIRVEKTGIYKFSFINNSIFKRVCRIKIQRIPAADSLRNFSSQVFWRVRHDTTYIPVNEKYLIKRDTFIVNVLDQTTAKVSSQNALNGNPNKTIVDFYLPEGTIAWSYYIGVDKAGRIAYEQGLNTFTKSAATVMGRLPGYGPMAALALYGVNYFSKVQGGSNVKYWFITNWDNVLAFKNGQSFYQYKQGDVINDASQMKSPLSGRVYLGLLNDNLVEPIEVIVRVTAIVVKEEYGVRTVNKLRVDARKEPYLQND